MSFIKSIPGSSLAVQWGGLWVFTAGARGTPPSGNYDPRCCLVWPIPSLSPHPTDPPSMPRPLPNSIWLRNIVIICTSGDNQRRNQTVWDKGKTSCRIKSKVCNCQRDGKAKKLLDRIIACVACPMKTLAGTADRARGSSMEQCAQAWVPLLLAGHTFQILDESSISS